MTLQQRLREYLSSKSLTYKDFERMCNLSNGTAARIRETTRPSTFDRIANKCDLNTHWLLTGEGEMLREAGESAAPMAEQSEAPTVERLLAELAEQRRLTAAAQAQVTELIKLNQEQFNRLMALVAPASGK